MPDAEGYVMVLQPEEPKISLSGIDHFARGAAEFESTEGVTLFPELRVVSTITREVEAEAEGEDEPTGMLPREKQKQTEIWKSESGWKALGVYGREEWQNESCAICQIFAIYSKRKIHWINETVMFWK